MYSLMVEFHYKFSYPKTVYILIGYGTYDEMVNFGKNHLGNWIEKSYHEEVGRFRNDTELYTNYVYYPFRIRSI